MKRKRYDTLVGLLVAVALYVSAFFVTEPSEGALWADTPGLSACAAFACLVLSSVVMLFLTGKVLASGSAIVLPSALVVLWSEPSLIYVSSGHFACLAISVSFYFLVKFLTDRPYLDNAALSTALMCAAAFFLPPLVWLLPVQAFAVIAGAQGKGAGVAAFLLGLLAAAVPCVAASYVLLDAPAFSDLFSSISSRMVSAQVISYAPSPVTIAKYCAVLLVLTVSLASIYSSSHHSKTAESRMTGVALAEFLALATVAVIFAGNAPGAYLPSLIVIAAVPVSYCFIIANRPRILLVTGIILVLSVLFERVVCFCPEVLNDIIAIFAS